MPPPKTHGMIANTIAMTRAVGRFDERFTPYPFKELRESALLQQKRGRRPLVRMARLLLTSSPFARLAVQPIGAALS